jgi:hypothetical protein
VPVLGRRRSKAPDEHADDLHRLISALDAGPVDMFATSVVETSGLEPPTPCLQSKAKSTL